LKNAGAVWLGEDGLFERPPDFASIYVKRGNKLDIAAAIAANGAAHDALKRSTLATAVVFNALNQGTGTISDASNRHFNVLSFRHRSLALSRSRLIARAWRNLPAHCCRACQWRGLGGGSRALEFVVYAGAEDMILKGRLWPTVEVGAGNT